MHLHTAIKATHEWRKTTQVAPLVLAITLLNPLLKAYSLTIKSNQAKATLRLDFPNLLVNTIISSARIKTLQ
jgi:hypothetical protein